ncbi:MAG: transposase [Pirellulales bacterium]
MGKRDTYGEDGDAAELASVAVTPDTSGADPAALKKARSPRKGLFTSGVVATRDGRRIVLFFSGRQHAGENLADVLQHRAEDSPPPIQMCDGLSRNYPPALDTILANCLVHARRKFVNVQDRFPDECRQVIEFLAEVYRVDDKARRLQLGPEDRLALHQLESQPVMADLKTWLDRQFAERLVEPNSSLGDAIRYMTGHWDQLTLFLRQPGAPLDNNLCERMLKMVIVHRKNALFYLTQRGAQVGDIYMSLIHTCHQCGASPMDYLVQLQEHAQDVAEHPERWLPWNYEEQLLVPVDVSDPRGQSDVDSIRRMRRHRRAELRRHAK